ncbi:MAG: HlyD family secretion protein [Anaerolineae bacterium]
MTVRRTFLNAAILGLLLLGPAATDAPRAADAASAPAPGALSRVPAVIAEASAEIVPPRFADLSFPTSGQIAEVAVAEGEAVASGQVLVVLDTTDLQAEIAQAEAALLAAEAQLDLLEALPRSIDVTVAEAQLAVTEASLAQAIARRSQITDETQQAAIAAAEADRADAKAQEMAARIHEIQQREFGVEAWQEEVNILRLRSAELALTGAEARLAQLPQQQRMTVAQQDALILQRRAQRDRAEASLAGVRGGASAAALAAAEARVEQAAVALQNARSRLAGTELLAPFAGTIVSLEIGVGEAVVPGQPLMTLADLTTPQVETTDLSEYDVAEIDVGMGATVYVEALDRDLSGRVTWIALQPTVVGGDVTYPVRITLDETPPDLRWGMSVEVAFESEISN